MGPGRNYGRFFASSFAGVHVHVKAAFISCRVQKRAGFIEALLDLLECAPAHGV
jgi:hypothetical protein